jgi:hypothetical protein
MGKIHKDQFVVPEIPWHKIVTRAGVLSYGFDESIQAYTVVLDFLDNTAEAEVAWDKFFEAVDKRKNNLIKVTIEE